MTSLSHYIHIFTLTLAVAFILLCSVVPVYAGTAYDLLAPIPASTNTISSPPTSQTPGAYIASAFRLGVGIAAALAVLVIAGNGLRYMLSDVVTSKSAAVQGIKNALWGLLLALGGFLLLNTISPQYAQNLSFGVGRMTASPNASSPSATGPGPAELRIDALVDEASGYSTLYYNGAREDEAEAARLTNELSGMSSTDPGYAAKVEEIETLLEGAERQRQVGGFYLEIVSNEQNFIYQLALHTASKEDVLGTAASAGTAAAFVADVKTRVDDTNNLLSARDRDEIKARADALITGLAAIAQSTGI